LRLIWGPLVSKLGVCLSSLSMVEFMCEVDREGNTGMHSIRKRHHKSKAKRLEEQLRLKQEIALQDGGATIRQIAAQLDVSERTVKRDLAKARSYLENRQREQLNAMSEAEWSDFCNHFMHRGGLGH
jgi:DNA-binding NarL/FixJ family response regulator